MIDVLVFQQNAPTTHELSLFYRKLSEEKLPIRRMNTIQDINTLLGNIHLYQLLLFYVSSRSDDYYLLHQKISELKHSIMVILVADVTSSLANYTLPDVCPDAILYQPLEFSQFSKAIRQSYKLLSDRLYQKQQQTISVNIGKTVHQIRISDIYFIESLGKKLAIKTRSQEVQIYGTFDQMIRQLPSNFVRCHKGFLVNMTKIYSVDYSAMSIQLSDQSIVPMSRTYKSQLKTQMKAGDNHE